MKCWDHRTARRRSITGPVAPSSLRYYILWLMTTIPQDMAGKGYYTTKRLEVQEVGRWGRKTPVCFNLGSKRASPPFTRKGGEQGCDSPERAYSGKLRRCGRSPNLSERQTCRQQHAPHGAPLPKAVRDLSPGKTNYPRPLPEVLRVVPAVSRANSLPLSTAQKSRDIYILRIQHASRRLVD